MIHDIPQRSDAWLSMRAGKLTASCIADALARTKTGWGASRANLKAKLVCERLTGQPQDTYSNAAMMWGVEQEPFARDAYAQHQLCAVVEVGFVDHPRIAWSGCSPDGFVAEDGLVEIKCPNTSTHIDILLGGSFPDKYVKQAMWQMACTGRVYCDLATYDPRLPEAMRLFIQRIPRDDGVIAELEREAEAFLAEVAETVEQLQEKYALELAA